jgi:hypothetical protein
MCFWSEIAPLELALAVRSGSLGANSDDELAGGGKIRKKQESRSKKEEGRRKRVAPFIQI